MLAFGPTRGPSREWRRNIFCAIVLFSFCALATRGQDVAEAARQEKARKAAEQKSTPHVYTEEDLKRAAILTPDDKARVEARKRQQNGSPAQQNAEQKPNDAGPLDESLGEIARRYRQEKAAREAELDAKKKIDPFPYDLPENSLAAPEPGLEPANVEPVNVEPLSIEPPSKPESGVEMNERTVPFVRRPALHFFPPVLRSHERISPFEPRPFKGTPSVPPAELSIVPTMPPRPPSAGRPMEKASSPIAVNPGPDRVPGMKRVEVQRGQSWWKLAELYLGSGARWPELRKLNVDAGGPPELLMTGALVTVPEALKGQKASPQTLRVEKGDSLWSLAHEHLGRGSAWTCLASANPQIVDYTHLAIGTTVRLPEDDALGTCRDGRAGKLQK
jgi:nucleoid-associated protein YgaU